jgi:hypothetical protein
LKALSDLIRSNKGFCGQRKSNRVSWQKVEYAGRIWEVAYDRNRKTICTILPEGTIQRKTQEA